MQFSAQTQACCNLYCSVHRTLSKTFLFITRFSLWRGYMWNKTLKLFQIFFKIILFYM